MPTEASFTDTEIRALCARGVTRTYPKHTVLVHEGDRSDQVFVVLDGVLKVYLADSNGKEIVIDTLGPGQLFGELSLDGEPRSASVMTTDVSKVAAISQEEFKRFLAENPDTAYQLILRLIRRARNLTRTVGNLALLDVYGRLAKLLLDSAKPESGQLVLPERMSQQDIANRIGASREMVSRILSDLRKGGYISETDNRIVIRKFPPDRW